MYQINLEKSAHFSEAQKFKLSYHMHLARIGLEKLDFDISSLVTGFAGNIVTKAV